MHLKFPIQSILFILPFFKLKFNERQIIDIYYFINTTQRVNQKYIRFLNLLTITVISQHIQFSPITFIGLPTKTKGIEFEADKRVSAGHLSLVSMGMKVAPLFLL
jgi:hypothetical protein